jgi:hypothetical protein
MARSVPDLVPSCHGSQLAPETEAARYTAMSTNFYYTIRLHIPEDSRGESSILKTEAFIRNVGYFLSDFTVSYLRSVVIVSSARYSNKTVCQLRQKNCLI